MDGVREGGPQTGRSGELITGSLPGDKNTFRAQLILQVSLQYCLSKNFLETFADITKLY